MAVVVCGYPKCCNAKAHTYTYVCTYKCMLHVSSKAGAQLARHEHTHWGRSAARNGSNMSIIPKYPPIRWSLPPAILFSTLHPWGCEMAWIPGTCLSWIWERCLSFRHLRHPPTQPCLSQTRYLLSRPLSYSHLYFSAINEVWVRLCLSCRSDSAPVQ